MLHPGVVGKPGAPLSQPVFHGVPVALAGGDTGGVEQFPAASSCRRRCASGSGSRASQAWGDNTGSFCAWPAMRADLRGGDDAAEGRVGHGDLQNRAGVPAAREVHVKFT